MKTLTPEQRMEGFTELETEIGEGGVGGAHLMSFLAGVAHAEKVLANQEQNAAPVGYVYSEYGNPRKNVALSNDSIPNGTPVYLHPAPRKFVRLSDEEIMDIYMKWINDNNGQPLGRAIEDALEERNK